MVKNNMKITDEITVCFDTNVYDQTKYNFNGLFFESFKNLKANKYPNLKIYMDPIIYHEILNHIKEKAQNTSKEITSLKKGLWNLSIFESLFNELSLEDVVNLSYEEAKNRLGEFIENFSEDSLDYSFSNYDMNSILNDYFNHNVPFERQKNKKSEFPDALIIQNLKNKFGNDKNFIVVSGDNGFLEAVRLKIPKTRLFKSFQDCADFLNKRHVEYQNTYSIVNNSIEEIKDTFLEGLSDMRSDYVPSYYAEKLGIKIDVTNFDRKGITELYDLYEVMISHIEIINSKIRILEINNEEGFAEAEVQLSTTLTIYGQIEDSDDLIEELHHVVCPIYVKLNITQSNVTDISPQTVILDRKTLKDRKIERDYFSYFEDYNPTLHPVDEKYTVVCDNCRYTNEFCSPDMEDFDISSSERSMGSDYLYTFQINEICGDCGQPLIIDITISEYPYQVLELEEISCSGGLTDLQFEIS
ncbi:hypothetical protein B8V18_04000 [Streptococcus agalactiae]|nr:hypothetical protein B8V37_03850 [Streptococcus agalactiae]KAF1157706.1 hypothetical protein B8V18_04000 [Streptococcus agalactiae]